METNPFSLHGDRTILGDRNNHNIRQNHDNEKCPSFVRLVFGNTGSWKYQDAQQRGFQSIHELQIRFQPFKLGVQYKGNTVTDVFPGTQAYIAGVRKQWTISTVNGKKMLNKSYMVKSSIDETNLRNEKTNILFIKKKIGNIRTITFKSNLIGIYYTGNRITKVDQLSQAHHAGVSKDWIIMYVNNQLMPNNSTTVQNAIGHASLKGNIVQITFQIPDKPINSKYSENKPIKKSIRQIREERTGTNSRTHAAGHDPHVVLPSMIDKIKSRVTNKYVIK